MGSPHSVSDGDVEENVLKIFEKVGCPIEGNNIKACHRRSRNNERIIVKFSRRKDCQNVLSAKKELKKLDIKKNCFSGGQSYICERKFVHTFWGVKVTSSFLKKNQKLSYVKRYC